MVLLVFLVLLWNAHSSNYSLLPTDVKMSIFGNLPGFDRAAVKASTREHNTIINEMYDKEMHEIKSKLFHYGLNNENAFNCSQQIKKLFIHQRHRNDLYFRKIFGRELPGILRLFSARNLSSNSIDTLFDAMGMHNSNDIISQTFLERESYRLIKHFCPSYGFPMVLPHPFPLIISSMFCKSISFNNHSLAIHTIVWDEQTLDNVLNEVIQNYYGIYNIGPFVFWYSTTFGFSAKPMVEINEFLTKCMLQILEIHNNQNISLEFRCNGHSFYKYLWIKRIVYLAESHYKAQNVDTFNKLIASLCTIFLDEGCIKLIYGMEGLESNYKIKVINTLFDLRSGWTRDSLINSSIVQ